MSGLAQDLRQGCRTLLKNPGFTAVAVLTLALGIGANTAIFSVIDAVLLRPLPYENPDGLVVVWEDATNIGFPHNTPAPANYVDWKTRNTVFQDMAALEIRGFSLTGDGEPEQVVSQAVTSNFFPLLGVDPLIGRTFAPDEDAPGQGQVAVLSYGLGQTRYGGDRSILGRRIRLSGQEYQVVGVMPGGFQFLQSYIKLWVPSGMSSQGWANRGSHYLVVAARLKAGVTVQTADAQIRSISAEIARERTGRARSPGRGPLAHRPTAGCGRRVGVVLCCGANHREPALRRQLAGSADVCGGSAAAFGPAVCPPCGPPRWIR